MSFRVRAMRADDLFAVYAVQCEAYSAHYHEPLEVLVSHFESGQDACLVAESAAGVGAYVLAHPWRGPPPALHLPICPPIQCDHLFIHDLAVAQALRRYGAALALVEAARAAAKRRSFSSIRLVSLADATGFWLKQGFSQTFDGVPSQEYGSAVLMCRTV